MYLETVTGKVVNVIEPSPEQISIIDIGWGLSRMSRFCGHTITEIPYNVAQHCIFVAEEIASIFADPEQYPELAEYHDQIRVLCLKQHEPNETVLLGLLHDGSEVFTGDLPSPIKKIPELRPIIKKVEHKLMSAIYAAFSLAEPTELQEIIIKHADKIAQRIEAHAFMQSRGNNWEGMPHVSLERLQKFQAPLKSLAAYNLFMEHFTRYYGKLERKPNEII